MYYLTNIELKRGQRIVALEKQPGVWITFESTNGEEVVETKFFLNDSDFFGTQEQIDAMAEHIRNEKELEQ